MASVRHTWQFAFFVTKMRTDPAAVNASILLVSHTHLLSPFFMTVTICAGTSQRVSTLVKQVTSAARAMAHARAMLCCNKHALGDAS